MRADQNYAIDIVKYIMAFCVIAIHTLPLKNVQNEVYGFAIFKFIAKRCRKFESYSIIAICIAVILQYSTDYIMAIPAIENRLLEYSF